MTTTSDTNDEAGHVTVTLVRQRPRLVQVIEPQSRTLGSIAVYLDGATLYLTEAGARRLLSSLTVAVALLDSERDVPAAVAS